jgi:chromate reductase
MFSLAQAHNAFTDDGHIANEQLHERFEANIANFMDLVEAAKHYPCVKRLRVEYLGRATGSGRRPSRVTAALRGEPPPRRRT